MIIDLENNKLAGQNRLVFEILGNQQLYKKATFELEFGDYISNMSFSVVFFLWHCQHNSCIFSMSKTGPPLDIGMMWSTVSKARGNILPHPKLEYLSTP